MRKVIVTGTPRTDLAVVDALGAYGVATVHEALGRTGYLGTHLRPVQHGARVAGNAVTVLCAPGDNLMVHAAVEQCREGDIVVVTTTSPCTDGAFGELLATSLRAHGARGLVTEGGVRDVAELNALGFPVWSAAVSAQGTEKAVAGAVNVPIVAGGGLVRPGDVIVADDDGVVCVPRADAPSAVRAARAREEKEEATRAALKGGELGLDRYGLRSRLRDLGVEYVTAAEYDAGD